MDDVAPGIPHQDAGMSSREILALLFHKEHCEHDSMRMGWEVNRYGAIAPVVLADILSG